jgi:hypothetical protein
LTQLFLGLSITASMPFCAKPAKDSLQVLFNIDDSNNYKMHFFLCFVTCFSALFSSMLLSNMSVVFNLVGSVSSPLICFVFPALFYLKSIKNITFWKKLFL